MIYLSNAAFEKFELVCKPWLNWTWAWNKRCELLNLEQLSYSKNFEFQYKKLRKLHFCVTAPRFYPILAVGPSLPFSLCFSPRARTRPARLAGATWRAMPEDRKAPRPAPDSTAPKDRRIAPVSPPPPPSSLTPRDRASRHRGTLCGSSSGTVKRKLHRGALCGLAERRRHRAAQRATVQRHWVPRHADGLREAWEQAACSFRVLLLSGFILL